MGAAAPPNDTQIAKEQFLEDINNVLNTGEVPNLIQSEDMERIMSNVSLKVKALGRQETRGQRGTAWRGRGTGPLP